jgi:hypothetical protein
VTDQATPSVARAAAEAFFGVGRGIASTVYGTIVTMATLTAAYATEKDPWRLAAIVASTALVLWVAHLYAHALSETIAQGARPGRRTLYAIARIEIGILFAAVAPVIALALGAGGVLREPAAIWLALSIGLVTLAVEGFRFARLEHFSLWRTLVATGVNLALGLLVVLLKVTVEH